jgi:CRISPR-associated protein (TIGR03984 family)
MSRKIETTLRTIIPIPVDAAFTANPAGWLLDQAKIHNLTWLLAYADDGVIWGKAYSNTLWLSGQVKPIISPPLQGITLQQARLFASRAELLLWRDNDQWSARLITDGAGEKTWYYDEKQILWGNKRIEEESTEQYTVTADGEQGFRQVIPIPTTGPQFAQNKRPFYLKLRHYLSQDTNSGMYRVTLSRLTDLNVEDAQ